jgi:catechol 2,3-dioxygenase-like lactoylglutathione lyase family enzyme
VSDAAAGQIESINAVTLAVSDMPRSVAFYDALGFALAAGGEDTPFTTFVVGAGFLNLQLDPTHAPVPRIWGRVIFFVDDVDEMHRRAIAAGMTPAHAPSDAPWGERYFHLHDPDGHELSFARPI